MNITTEPVPRIQVMSTSPTSAKSRRVSRDTGFPEPLNGDRNTTLPHPEADLSPNACISQEDFDPDRVLKRHRRSFMRKNRHTLQHGKITPQTEAVHSVLSLVSIEMTESYGYKLPRASLSTARLSKDGTDSLASRRDEDTPPTSPDIPSHRSKKGFLKKWRKD